MKNTINTQSSTTIKITKFTIGGAHRAENFPVASIFLRKNDRKIVKAFYHFARFADDIADSPTLAMNDKLCALEVIGQALDGSVTNSNLVDISPALALRHYAEERGLSLQTAQDLLVAFKQDAKNISTENWDSLLEYCQYSAVPVGRFLLELHNEGKETHPPADALCSALQILNHVQDIREDYCERQRHYIPLVCPDGSKVELNELSARYTSPTLQKSITYVLDRVEELLDQAEVLPELIQAVRLRAEATAILSLARALLQRLRTHDPMHKRITPNLMDILRSAKKAVFSLFNLATTSLLTKKAAQQVEQVVQQSGSSFRHGMKCLPRPRREAMYTIYALCRILDDIADSDAYSPDQKLSALEVWEKDLKSIGLEQSPKTKSAYIDALLAVNHKYGLNIEECNALIAGMRMDANGPVLRPSEAEFTLYCRRVAVSVGLICLPIMGAYDAKSVRFAHELGHALQCVNIVRDIREDAIMKRCYLPDELLTACGITDHDANTIAQHPNVGQARTIIAERAKQHFKNAHTALTQTNYKALRPARLMMIKYMELLKRIEAQGIDNLTPPPKTNLWEKLYLLTQIPKPLPNKAEI